MQALGVDIGGTGIKGAPVDVGTGVLAAARFRVVTPSPATPAKIADTVATVVDHFGWHGPVACSFPAVVKHGVVLTASNVDQSWIGTDAAALFSDRLGTAVEVHNDAELAGVAEMRFGAGKGRAGVVHIVTLGTGIGSALFHDGVLVPNTELGHIELGGVDAEQFASERAREVEGLSWKQWAKRVQKYLHAIENLLWPDLIVVGGGVSKQADKWLPHVSTRTELVPAALRNDAGIVGAALTAADR